MSEISQENPNKKVKLSVAEIVQKRSKELDFASFHYKDFNSQPKELLDAQILTLEEINKECLETVILQLYVTRHGELFSLATINVFRSELTMRTILEVINDFYSTPFTEQEVEKIKKGFEDGTVSDLFGYIKGSKILDIKPGETINILRGALLGEAVNFEGFEQNVKDITEYGLLLIPVVFGSI